MIARGVKPPSKPQASSKAEAVTGGKVNMKTLLIKTWLMTQIERCGKFYKKYYVKHIECIKCETAYPMLGGAIFCNGQIITDCPYCTKQKGEPNNG